MDRMLQQLRELVGQEIPATIHGILSVQEIALRSGNGQRLGGNGMEFRLLSPDDLALVVGMEGDFRSGFIVEESARRFLCNPQNLLFAAITDCRIIGFAYGYRHPRLDGQGDKVYIHEVGVLPAWQRLGVGRRLLELIKSYCHQAGCPSFFLFTQRSNHAACGLYQSAGGVDPHGDNMVYWFDAGARG